MAVKVLNASLATDPAAVDRFFHEVRIVGSVRHPHIVAILGVGYLPDERPFFAMDFLEGRNLRRVLQDSGRLEVLAAYEILEQVASGLAAAHAVGIVHCDLKAENVIVDAHRCVKLVDFGVARLLADEGATPSVSASYVAGTLTAMAPEQIRGEPVDQRTDVYALGALSWNVLTGVSLFRGSRSEVTRMHLELRPHPPSSLVPVPPAVDAVVLRALEKDPAARHPSIEAFVDALRLAVFGVDEPLRTRLGLGILVRAQLGEQPSEGARASAVAALDAAEAALGAAGYQVVHRGPVEVLGVREAPAAPEAEAEARRQVLEDSHRIYRTARGVLGVPVRLGVLVHANEAHVRVDSGRIVGGPLLELGAWGRAHEGVRSSARFTAVG